MKVGASSMSIVIDPSFAAGWLLPDEGGALADEVLDRVSRLGARVPSLFWHELRNLLLVAERRGRVPPNEADSLMQSARTLRIAEGSVDDGVVLDLARRHRLTAYDATYLALAIAEGVPIATADAALAKAARRENVDVRGDTL
jgi:predicted nucleic acid-binding protein